MPRATATTRKVQGLVDALSSGESVDRDSLMKLLKVNEGQLRQLVSLARKEDYNIKNSRVGGGSQYRLQKSRSRSTTTSKNRKSPARKRRQQAQSGRTVDRRRQPRKTGLPALGSQAIIVEDIIDLRGSSPKVIAKMTVGDQQIETVWDLDEYPQELLNQPLSVVGRKPNGRQNVVSLSDGRQEFEVTV